MRVSQCHKKFSDTQIESQMRKYYEMFILRNNQGSNYIEFGMTLSSTWILVNVCTTIVSLSLNDFIVQFKFDDFVQSVTSSGETETIGHVSDNVENIVQFQFPIACLLILCCNFQKLPRIA